MQKINILKLKKELVEDPDFVGVLEIIETTREELQRIRESEYDNSEDKWYAAKVEYMKVILDGGDFIVVKEKETDWECVPISINYTLYYDVERVVVEEEMTETTKEWRKMEEKYKEALKRVSFSEELRKAVIREWLQKRLEFLQKNAEEIETKERIVKYYNAEITEKVFVNREDGEVLYIVDNRFEVGNQSDYNDLYKKIFYLF